MKHFQIHVTGDESFAIFEEIKQIRFIYINKVYYEKNYHCHRRFLFLW